MAQVAPKVTVRDLRACHQQGRPIVAVTAYDACFARLLDEGGVDVILVGDSMGNTMLGYPNTLRVTLEQSLHHTAAVVRGVSRALVVGDMPFLSYQTSPDDAVRNAGRYLQEAGADAIKLEGGQFFAPLITRLVQCGIPVMGHVGLMPQHVLAEGGYRLHGKEPAEAARVLADAIAVQDAGAFAIVLEGITPALGKEITEQLRIPTIGIGAGPHCSGQIQVIHDLLGLSGDATPRHAKRYADLASEIRRVAQAYVREVQDRHFPAPKDRP